MITITKEIIEKANTYLPMEEKRRWCEEIASLLIVNVPMEATNADTGEKEALPDRYEEQPVGRQMALAALLGKTYLGVVGADDKLSAKDYDELLSSFIPNQLERFKGDKDVKNKVFDILYDYNETKKMLNAVLMQRLGHLNDPVIRMMAFMKTVTLEALAKSKQELAETVAETKEYAEHRDEIRERKMKA